MDGAEDGVRQERERREAGEQEEKVSPAAARGASEPLQHGEPPGGTGSKRFLLLLLRRRRKRVPRLPRR